MSRAAITYLKLIMALILYVELFHGSQLVHRLQAVPSKVAPMFLTGNLGEVLLLGSLVASEGILRSQGL